MIPLSKVFGNNAANLIYLGPYRVSVYKVYSKKIENENTYSAEIVFLDRNSLDFDILGKLCQEFTITFDDMPTAIVDYDKLSEHPWNNEMGKTLYT